MDGSCCAVAFDRSTPAESSRLLGIYFAMVRYKGKWTPPKIDNPSYKALGGEEGLLKVCLVTVVGASKDR